MKRFRPSLLAGALALAAAACDVPFAPRWDADWYVPLQSQKITLTSFFPAFVPAGTSANVSFPPQAQKLDASIGEILRQDLRAASVVMTLTKSVAISGNDTLFVASSRTNLSNGDPSTITFPVVLTATATLVQDTLVVNPAGLTMLRTVATADDSLFIQLRGRNTNPGPGSLTLSPSDSIGIRLALIARIGVSTRK